MLLVVLLVVFVEDVRLAAVAAFVVVVVRVVVVVLRVVVVVLRVVVVARYVEPPIVRTVVRVVVVLFFVVVVEAFVVVEVLGGSILLYLRTQALSDAFPPSVCVIL